MGVFAQIMMGLAEQDPDNKTISINATYLKTYRTASSLRSVGIEAFADHDNRQRLHESINNLTPSDVYICRDKAILQ